jgi:hypothetical protein
MTLLVVANRTIQPNEIRNAIVDSPAVAAVGVALVVPASGRGRTRHL